MWKTLLEDWILSKTLFVSCLQNVAEVIQFTSNHTPPWKMSLLKPSRYKSYKPQWLQYFFLSDSGPWPNTAPDNMTKPASASSVCCTSCGSGAGETSCRPQWWCDSERTRAWCFHCTGRRGCDKEEKYLGKEHTRELQADALGHLFPKSNIGKDKKKILSSRNNLGHPILLGQI